MSDEEQAGRRRPAGESDAGQSADLLRLAEESERAQVQADLLREQNEILRDLLARQKDYRPVAHTALGVFVAFLILWAVAQTEWGADNFGVPVKNYVSESAVEDAEEFQDDQERQLREYEECIADPNSSEELCRALAPDLSLP